MILFTFILALAVAAVVTLWIRTERMHEMQAQIDDLQSAVETIRQRLDAQGDS